MGGATRPPADHRSGEPPAAGGEDLVDVVRAGWLALAGPGAGFAPAVRTAVAPGSRLCPPGWCGVVSVGGATTATAPDAVRAAALDRALALLPTRWHTDGGRLTAALGGAGAVRDVLGPARLAYLAPTTPPPDVPAGVRAVAPDDPLVRDLLAGCPGEDVREADVGSVTSPAFVVVRDGRAVAVAGHGRWPSATAHLCVLTHRSARGAGLARAVATAATAHALRAGLLPQWRARPAASAGLARALGYRVLGSQLSLLLPA